MKVTQGIITSKFGMRTHPATGVRRMHNGVDISAPEGTPVFCPAGGLVAGCGMNPTMGNYIQIQTGKMTYVFMHLSSINVVRGQYVLKGQLIGAVGKTGLATGSHLHFEVHINNIPVNPEPYINF